MVTTTKRSASGPLTRQQEIDHSISVKGGFIAIIWEPDSEPNAPQTLSGVRSVRSFGYKWVDQKETDKRIPNKNGRTPAFKEVELARPGLNWIDSVLWAEALAEAKRRKEDPELREIDPIELRIRSGAIRVFQPKENLEALTGTISDYSDNDAAELIRAVYDVDVLRAYLKASDSPAISAILQEQIRVIESEGAAAYM
jgi:hypothetical protein